MAIIGRRSSASIRAADPLLRRNGVNRGHTYTGLNSIVRCCASRLIGSSILSHASSGSGGFRRLTLNFQDHVWSASESAWKTPRLKELIVYEVMLHEFRGDLEHAAERLPYLADLGINCIEVMPITNVEAKLNWGFEPIGFLGVDERFGNRINFQRFVDIAHQNGIAVILDVVYGHTGANFPYEYVYSRLGYRENPFMGSFAKDMFGPSTDWTRPIVRDYFFTVNHFWLEKCHVDGYRYDCVPNYWDGPTGVGYSDLVYETYKFVNAQAGAGHWQRFSDGSDLNLIQCAEQLEDPKGIVWQTYTNSTWQNETLVSAQAVAHGDRGRLYDLGLRLGLDGFPKRQRTTRIPCQKARFSTSRTTTTPVFWRNSASSTEMILCLIRRIDRSGTKCSHISSPCSPRKGFLCFGKDKNWERTTLFRNEGSHESV